MLLLSKIARPAIVTPLAMSAGLGLGLTFGAGAMAMSPAAATAVGIAIASVACSSTQACVSGTNTGTGPGVAGTSSHGTGVSGTSTSAYGVYGTSKTGVGVKAVSTSSSAIFATSASNGYATINVQQTGFGSEPAIKATATSGDGLIADSPQDTGVIGTGLLQGGAFEGTTNPGVSGSTLGEGSAGVYGSDVVGSGGGSYGVQGESPHNVAGSFLNDSGNGSDVLDLKAGTTGRGSYIISAQSSDASHYMRVDDRGNEYLSGELFTAGGCHGCSAMRIGSYAPHESEPTMEDVGAGHLVNGVSYVSLDPAFRSVVDQMSDYHVLVTPEGDSNGVFVSARSANGFFIRENHGGHSSVAFSYRIVAKPFGLAHPRLPTIALPTTSVKSARIAHRLTRLGVAPR